MAGVGEVGFRIVLPQPYGKPERNTVHRHTI